jgi:hypothetical protein
LKRIAFAAVLIAASFSARVSAAPLSSTRCESWLWSFVYANGGDTYDAINEYLGDKVQMMNPVNMADAVTCECMLDKRLNVQEAADRVIKVEEAGLYAVKPVGGTMSPKDQRFRQAFQKWVAGHGPRPTADGALACSYVRD